MEAGATACRHNAQNETAAPGKEPPFIDVKSLAD